MQGLHKPLVVCSKNAKSCYDCIVLIVAALCLCQLSAPKPAVQSMIATIYSLQHHIWSTYGNLIQSQERVQWSYPTVGIGQGSGAKPHIWVPGSSPLFQILTQEGIIAQILCMISGHQMSLARFGFVDNVSLCITTPHQTGITAVQQMQESLTIWTGLL